jgi:hypothetical protein
MLQGGAIAMLTGEGPRSIVESHILCPHCRSWTHIALVWASTDRCPECLRPLMTPNRRPSSPTQSHKERSRRAITVAGERQPTADRRGY